MEKSQLSSSNLPDVLAGFIAEIYSAFTEVTPRAQKTTKKVFAHFYLPMNHSKMIDMKIQIIILHSNIH